MNQTNLTFFKIVIYFNKPERTTDDISCLHCIVTLEEYRQRLKNIFNHFYFKENAKYDSAKNSYYLVFINYI